LLHRSRLNSFEPPAHALLERLNFRQRRARNDRESRVTLTNEMAAHTFFGVVRGLHGKRQSFGVEKPVNTALK